MPSFSLSCFTLIDATLYFYLFYKHPEQPYVARIGPCQKFRLSSCCNKKTNKTLNGMAKVQIKSENLTPLEGFFDDGTIK